MRQEGESVSLAAAALAAKDAEGGSMRQVDEQRLRELWADDTMTKNDIAMALGIRPPHLAAIEKSLNLPVRPFRARSFFAILSEEEYEARKREVRERHFAAKRSEPERVTVRRLERARAKARRESAA